MVRSKKKKIQVRTVLDRRINKSAVLIFKSCFFRWMSVWSLAITSVPQLSHPYVTDNYGMAAEGHGDDKVELFISSAWQSPGVCLN